MNITSETFPGPDELAAKMAEILSYEINGASAKGTSINIALSGGSTPKLLFSKLADHFADSVEWRAAKFFWVDERCVPTDHIDSNFGITEKLLLSRIAIPSENVYRMKGEEDPAAEAARYSSVIRDNMPQNNGLPRFNVILLGLGEDGHTASIFPGDDDLLTCDEYCSVAVHPVSGQNRITLTGKVINNAEKIFFLVTGTNKAGVVSEILRKKANFRRFPAAHINPLSGTMTFLLDRDAASLLLLC